MDGEAFCAIAEVPLQDTVSVLFVEHLREEADLVLVDLELGPGDGNVVEEATDALETGRFSRGQIAQYGRHTAFREEHSVNLQLTYGLRWAD